MRTRSPRRLFPVALCILALAPPAAADDVPDFFDSERFRLVRAEDGAHLRSDDGLDVAVPAEWLRPPEVVEQEKHHYVTSLDWEEGVTAFPVGEGLLGLHLSSYTISREGSARAASGRDLFLVLDPAAGTLHRGLDLEGSKGRVRLGGCWEVWFHHVAVGDVDCDRRLDVAVVEERMSCEPTETRMRGTEEETWVTMDQQYHRFGPRRWFVFQGGGWAHEARHDDRLPCTGLRDLPLLGLIKSPVDFILERYRDRPPLFRDSGQGDEGGDGWDPHMFAFPKL